MVLKNSIKTKNRYPRVKNFMFSNIEETYVHPLDYNKKYTMRKRFIEFDFHNDFYKQDLAFILTERFAKWL